MIHYQKFHAGILLLFFSCNNLASSDGNAQPAVHSASQLPKTPAEVNEIAIPAGYKRISGDPASFTEWLGKVSLKKNKTVYLYDGSEKQNQSAQYAVLDISVGNQNLQQCADAVMRLRAEYLYSIGKYDRIIFTDNAGKKYKFSQPYDRTHFQHYLNTVFGMCGSASLSKELKSKDLQEIAPGDVFIRGGFPGHAVIVMEAAENAAGEKMYLLAQSYMPAQDIHILNNPNDDELSPWYKADDRETIITPEYVFRKSELKGW
jgi:hypothetical protein